MNAQELVPSREMIQTSQLERSLLNAEMNVGTYN